MEIHDVPFTRASTHSGLREMNYPAEVEDLRRWHYLARVVMEAVAILLQ